MSARIRGILQNRLRIEALVTEHPEIERIPLQRPLVIAGLQRTGTTLSPSAARGRSRARAHCSGGRR